VHHVLERMRAGVDFCLDVHGARNCPMPSRPMSIACSRLRRRSRRCARASSALAARDGDFRVDGGYNRPHAVAAPVGFCGPQIISRFQAPALTLELPYKTVPDADGLRHEFGPAGWVRMGRACVAALHACLDAIVAVKRTRGAEASEPSA
jgi:hypothetical protein